MAEHVVKQDVHLKDLERSMNPNKGRKARFCVCFSSKEGVWSDNGCLRAGGNLSYSVCVCNHLTNFAILMQVVPVEVRIINPAIQGMGGWGGHIGLMIRGRWMLTVQNSRQNSASHCIMIECLKRI